MPRPALALLDDRSAKRYEQWIFDRGQLDPANAGVLDPVQVKLAACPVAGGVVQEKKFQQPEFLDRRPDRWRGIAGRLRRGVCGVGARFGPEVLRLHRLATGDLVVPPQPERPDPPAMRRVILDDPEEGVTALLAVVEREIDPLVDEVGHKGRALAALELGFRFERLGEHVEPVVPAAPTLP